MGKGLFRGKEIEIEYENEYLENKMNNYCPICKRKINHKENIVIIKSNNIFFPDIAIHKHCYKIHGLTGTCIRLKKMYTSYKAQSKYWTCIAGNNLQ